MPLDASASADPPVELARRIAEVVKGWLAPDSPERVRDADTLAPRRIAAGDVMILVRSRGAFFEAMIRALKEARVKTAGADRLTLRDSIAVMDLIAVGRSALLPDDDLTLAAALKSPLVGLDDDALIALAPRRAGSLAQALAKNAEPRFAAGATPRRGVAPARRRTIRPTSSTRVLSARTAGGARCLRGSDPRPPTRSTNSWRSPSPTNERRRRRSTPSSRKSRRRISPSSATWRTKATACA